jgi:hypothetical protein
VAAKEAAMNGEILQRSKLRCEADPFPDPPQSLMMDHGAVPSSVTPAVSFRVTVAIRISITSAAHIAL